MNIIKGIALKKKESEEKCNFKEKLSISMKIVIFSQLKVNREKDLGKNNHNFNKEKKNLYEKIDEFSN